MKQTTKEKEYRGEVRSLLEKIVVNVGVGRASNLAGFDDKILPQIQRDLAAITGQHPQLRPAVKSIAGFKVREGQTVGLRVTLRKAKMIDFFERLIRIVLPRVRDFRGIDEQHVDQSGTLNMGIKDHIVFSEIEGEKSPYAFSLGLNIVPKKKNRAEAVAAYRKLGVPFKK